MFKLKKFAALLLTGLMIIGAATGCNLGSSKSLNNKDKVFRDTSSWPPAASYVGNPFSPKGIGWQIYSTTFEGLFSYIGVSGVYYNRLAESFEDTGEKTTIKLHKNVKWNDGKPFTSKDIWAYYTMNYGTEVTRYLKSIELPDDYTVVFNWQQPVINQQIKIRMIAVNVDGTIPYHIYQKYVDKVNDLLKKGTETTDISKKGAFGKEYDENTQKELQATWKEFTNFGPKIPVGTGPFVLKNITDSEAVMLKNKHYWQKDNVKFEKLLLKKVDTNTATALLKAGELERADGTPPKDVMDSILAGNKDLVHYMTLDNASIGMSFNIQKKPFNDSRFRQAIIYALDRNKIKDVGNYYGQVSEYASIGMPFSYASEWINQDVMDKMTKYSYDTDKAAQLLKEIGWTKGSDGKWKDADGKVPNFIIGVSNQFQFVNPAQTAAEQLTAFGLPTQVKSVDPTVFYTKAQTDHEYEMAVDWIENSWGIYSPFGAENGYYYGFAGTAGNFPLYDSGPRIYKLNMVYTGPNGEQVDVADTLSGMMTMNDTEMKNAGSQLAWIANENVLSIPFYQNASGFWLNSKTIKGLPLQDLIKQYDRNIPIPQDPKQRAEVHDNWYIWVANGLQFASGQYEPN